MNSQNFRIFCDMDGVLTNFRDAFKKIDPEGLDPDVHEAKYGKGSIWPLITEKGVAYWENLEWLSDGQYFWTYLQQYNPTILSAPSRHWSSKQGKMNWISANLGISQKTPVTKYKDWDKSTRVILSQHKYLYVLPEENFKSILIDDTPGKIDKWVEAGGIGILHINAADTISKLEDILKNGK